MHQFPFHLWGDHEPLPTTWTLLDIQHWGDGNGGIAAGTLDGHASSRLIDNEVFAACFTFEEDVGHLLASEDDNIYSVVLESQSGNGRSCHQPQSELEQFSCRSFLAAAIAFIN
jgi:hypothetical protein